MLMRTPSINGVVIFNKRIESALLLHFVLVTVMTVIQSFPVGSVPVSDIRLAYFEQFQYGVFGWCVTGPPLLCTGERIGYKSIDTRIPNQRLLLPSESKYSVSKLLTMHIVSFVLSLVLWILITVAMFTSWQDSPTYLLYTALLAMAMFIFALLSFLVDILLFQTSLNWPGWLMLVVAITAAFEGSMLWSYRRHVEMRYFTALHSGPTNVNSTGATTTTIQQYYTHNNAKGTYEDEDRLVPYSLETLPLPRASHGDQSTGFSAVNASEGPLLQPAVTYHGMIEG